MRGSAGVFLAVLCLAAGACRPALGPGPAAQELAALMEGVGPHPVGSPANRLLADRLANRLRSLGLEVDRQRAFVCGDRRGYCGEIENIVGRRQGTAPSGTIVLASHYDSVPASPGAADSMAGVAAILEVADLERRLPPPRNTVVYLLTDGEEAGLLGSTAFVRWHPWAAGARAFVNLEARGSRGASFLAEAYGPSLDLVRSFARASSRPSADSGIADLVRLLPNANDLDVYAAKGAPGLMFGFVGGYRSYHSASDTVARLSPPSLRQHVENARAAFLPLRSADLRRLDARRAGFATVFGRTFVWPEKALRPLSAAVLALTACLLFLGVRAGRPARDVVAGAWVSLAALVAGAAAGLATLAIVRAFSFTRTSFPARLEPGAIAAAAGGVLAALALATWIGRRRDPRAFWLGGWAAWSALAAVAGWRFAPYSHWFLLPAGAGLILGAATARAGRKGRILAMLFGVVGAMFVLFPPLAIIVDLAGLAALPVVGGVAALVAAAAAPLLFGARRASRAVAGAGLIWIVLLVAACRVASFTADQPQFLTLLYALDHDSGTAKWIATGTPLPSALESRARFSGWIAPFGWLDSESGTAAPAPRVDIVPPAFVVDSAAPEGAGWVVEGRLSSPRGAPVMHLAFPPGSRASELRVAGQAVPRLDERNSLFASGYRVATIWDLPPEGISIRFRTPARPTEIVLVDRSPGLPAEGPALAAARPAEAAPNQNGDSTLVQRRIRVDGPPAR